MNVSSAQADALCGCRACEPARTPAATSGEAAAPSVLVFDPSKPDGMPRKLLDVTRLHDLGWRHRIDLADGIRSTYEWYREHAGAAGGADARA
jgi:nucleoside-diphosphate-sugar epimerase